jgi:hypothetical protein
MYAVYYLIKGKNKYQLLPTYKLNCIQYMPFKVLQSPVDVQSNKTRQHPLSDKGLEATCYLEIVDG